MKSPVQIDLGVKAQASLSVNSEIPQKSMGRLVDAITDIFRPFSEARGLRADHIRLQREEVAIEIARRARERLAIEEAEIKPVDGKILIPLIEKSSLEDPKDNEMIDRWSALLASAAKHSSVEPRYVQILSELTSRQAHLFEIISENSFGDNLENPRSDLLKALVDVPVTLDSSWIRKKINDIFFERKMNLPVDSIYEKITEEIDVPGAIVIDVILYRHSSGAEYSIDHSKLSRYWHDKFELDLEILSSLGLLKKANILYMSKFKDDIQVVYYHLTELGVGFFKSVDRGAAHKAQ